ncbi:hypothetical protein C1H46_022833 [Malus baccata]|uniref:glycerol-1-phosphatase n=1 Tax=Malus baccata TaxID=106549 RepID=A0A540LYK2_MALBA|nr:hypothetical protein C1H46_022833 [Malus baccata]
MAKLSQIHPLFVAVVQKEEASSLFPQKQKLLGSTLQWRIPPKLSAAEDQSLMSSSIWTASYSVISSNTCPTSSPPFNLLPLPLSWSHSSALAIVVFELFPHILTYHISIHSSRIHTHIYADARCRIHCCLQICTLPSQYKVYGFAILVVKLERIIVSAQILGNKLMVGYDFSADSDTEKFYTEVQEKILARYNKTFDWSLKAKMMGKKAIEAAQVFVEESGISDTLTAEGFLVEREAVLQSLFPTSELMPGASRLIRHLHAKGIPCALATGSQKTHFELKTQKHGKLFSLMHHLVLGDDPEVKQGKPAPDVFLAAAKRFEGSPIDPKKILVFEDAPAGVLAAKNAGMKVVMVPDPRLDSCFYDIADQVLKSLLDLNPSDWGLPPFDNPAS